MNRRHFLEGMAGTAAALASAGLRGGPMLPIVDNVHQHLWDLDRFRLAWMTSGRRAARPELPAGRLRQRRPCGLEIIKSIRLEVDVVPEQQVAEAEHVLGLIRDAKTPHGRRRDLGSPLVRRIRGVSRPLPILCRAIKGVRQVLHAPRHPAGYCLDPAFVRGIRELGVRGLSFDLCMRSAELGDAAKLIDSAPETRFVLDHCGNESVLEKDHTPWKRAIDAIAAKGDRVVCKVSGIVASAKGHRWDEDDLAPVVNHVLDSFGPDRVMFGGDWPVCTLAASYRRWVEALGEIVKGRPEGDRKKLFHDNAVRFYGLS